MDAPRWLPWSTIPTERRVESFADDLNTRRGIVSGRVALLPRSTEIQPFVAPIRPSLPTLNFIIFSKTNPRLGTTTSKNRQVHGSCAQVLANAPQCVRMPLIVCGVALKMTHVRARSPPQNEAGMTKDVCGVAFYTAPLAPLRTQDRRLRH